jgi:hypothetical protein
MKNDLKDLDPSKFPETSGTLELDLGDIVIPEVNEEEAQKVQENAEALSSWMKTHMAKLDGLSEQPEAVRARPEIKKAIRAITDKIHVHMGHSEAGYRQIAWSEFLLHEIESPDIKTWDDLDRTINWMVRRQYLEENEHGPLETPWKKRFSIPKTASFGVVQLNWIKDAWEKMRKRISKESAENRAERAGEIRSEMDTSDIDLLKSEANGTALLYVPGEISFWHGEAIPKLFNPGLLVVRREGKKLFPLEGIGSFDKRIDRPVRGKTHVLAYTLEWACPPQKKKLVEGFGFTEDQADDLIFTWNLLKRSFRHLGKSEEGPHEELVTFGKQASIPANEFLINHDEGIALIEIDGQVVMSDEQRKRTVIDKVFFLVERGKNRKLKLLAVPNHLQPLLSAEAVGEEYSEGDQFNDLPQPLQALMKMAFYEASFKTMLED